VINHGFNAALQNGSAASELPCRCALLHHGSGLWAHRIQGRLHDLFVCDKRRSPPIVIPTHLSVPSCSQPSRPSLPVAAKASSPDRSCARRRLSIAWSGRGNGAFGSNKETDDENG
jgi:hypothetical protein